MFKIRCIILLRVASFIARLDYGWDRVDRRLLAEI
ncbi:MAG: hypothetical protein CM1200mP41_22980 [Gammaproteobacteria bacterium]|nr:MAG: hypothetical protein CM1200mP41_22980 [Gammaproteobacteria bacterium]